MLVMVCAMVKQLRKGDHKQRQEDTLKYRMVMENLIENVITEEKRENEEVS